MFLNPAFLVTMTQDSENPTSVSSPPESQEIPGIEELLANRRASNPDSQRPNTKRGVNLSESTRMQRIIFGSAILAGIIVFLIFKPTPGSTPPVAAAPTSPKAPSPPPQAPPLPASGPVDFSTHPSPTATSTSGLPALVQRGSVLAADFPTLELPIVARHFSPQWVKTSILTEHKLPPREAVRLEEILNLFPLKFTGIAAIAGNPVKDASPRQLATLATETLPCPWKPSATLLLISLRGNPNADCEIKLAFHSNPESVFRYRLLGFAPVNGAETEPLSTRLPANSTTLLAVEIEPTQPGGLLGNLEWSANGFSAPAIALSHHLDSEPSDDARFAALVCSFSQWLAGDQTGVLDAEIVSALAREISSTSLPQERADFLDLIDHAIRL